MRIVQGRPRAGAESGLGNSGFPIRNSQFAIRNLKILNSKIAREGRGRISDRLTLAHSKGHRAAKADFGFPGFPIRNSQSALRNLMGAVGRAGS